MSCSLQKLLAASFCVLLAACGGGGGSDDGTSPQTGTTTGNGASGNNSGSTGGDTPNHPDTGTGNGTPPAAGGSDGNNNPTPTTPTSWTITDLTAARGLPTIANDINNNGDVVGEVVVESVNRLAAQNKEDGFLYRNGTFINLGNLGGTYTNANAININGTIIGVSTTQASRSVIPNGFVYDKEMRDFSTLGGTFNFLKDINDNGEILGSDQNGRAMLFTNGETQIIENLPGNNTISLNALNNRGQVLGQSGIAGNLSSTRSFLYSNGNTQDLSKVNGCQASNFQALNDAGELAGDCDGRLVIKIGETLKNLGSLAEYTTYNVQAMNNAGQVAGFAMKDDRSSTVFFYDGQKLIDLNTAPSIVSSGWKLVIVKKMNDRGQMVGLATPPGSDVPRHVLINPEQ